MIVTFMQDNTFSFILWRIIRSNPYLFLTFWYSRTTKFSFLFSFLPLFFFFFFFLQSLLSLQRKRRVWKGRSNVRNEVESSFFFLSHSLLSFLFCFYKLREKNVDSTYTIMRKEYTGWKDEGQIHKKKIKKNCRLADGHKQWKVECPSCIAVV